MTAFNMLLKTRMASERP